VVEWSRALDVRLSNSEPLASFSGLFRSKYKWILYLTTMYVYCVYPAMSKKSENLSDLNKKDRNKRHSSSFINVVKGVFFVVRITLVPVSYLSAPSVVHNYRVPGKFIRLVRIKQNHTHVWLCMTFTIPCIFIICIYNGHDHIPVISLYLVYTMVTSTGY
jgi:hypothetical protein